jgi:hypothetical protein
MCRIYFPFNNSHEDHVLLESEDGRTTHFYFDSEFKHFGVRYPDGNGDEIIHQERFEYDGVTGWRHLMIIHEKGTLTVYLDFQRCQYVAQDVQLWEPIRFVGNNKTGTKPFGLLADFR